MDETMKRLVYIGCMVAVMLVTALPVSAQFGTAGKAITCAHRSEMTGVQSALFSHTEIPVATFRSTSVEPTLNSAWSSSPKLYADGSPVDAYSSPVKRPIRRDPGPINPDEEEDDELPLGSAALPLMLMAAAYMAVRRRRYAFCRVMIEKDAKNQTI